MNRIIYLGLLLLVTLASQVYGQGITVTGTVTDANDGSSLPGVTVAVKGTTQGTVTNIDGVYELTTTDDAVLVFSFIGMESQEVPVDGRTVIDVVLESGMQSLSEVVVVGYGTAREVGTVIGSISKVGAAELSSRPAGNAMDALQGKVAGLQVYTSTGEPSQTSSMRLHGTGSLGSSSAPLYVLDGVPTDDTNIMSLSPNDIEDVTVLKDASATSIYGSRAANGVVYITTKRGSLGETTVTVNSQYGVSSLANPSYYDKFMNTQQLTDYWRETGIRNEEQLETIAENFPHDTDWEEYYFTDNAPTTQTDLSIEGGAGTTRFFVSGGYFSQEGITSRSGFDRYTFRANVQSRATEWLSFGTTVGLSHFERERNPNFGGAILAGGLFELTPPYYSPYDEDGNEVDLIPGQNSYSIGYEERKRPSSHTNTQLQMTPWLQINPIEGLTIRSQGGLDGFDWAATTIRLPSHEGFLNNGFRSETFQRGYTLSITNTAEYKFNVDQRHDFILLGGQEYYENTNELESAEVEGLTDDRLILLGEGDPNSLTVTHQKTQYAYSSFFGRFDYRLDDKYFVDFSLRQDNSSRFGVNHQSAHFWATGVMWKAKSEEFLADVDWLSSLDVKFSIGSSGNSDFGRATFVNDYIHLATIGTMTSYGGGTSWIIGSPGNPDLTWEKQQKTTFGSRFGFFEDRFRLNIEYFNRNTFDMLVAVPQPFTSGVPLDEQSRAVIQENVGDMVNRGVDFEFNFDLVAGNDYFVTPYANFSYVTNEVTALFQDRDYWIIPNTGVAWIVGQPLSFYYPLFAGIDPEDGAPMWYLPGDDIRETTRDPERVTKDFNTAELEQNTGYDRYPNFYGGFGLNSQWRGFGLSADFSFVSGKYMITNDRYFTENPTTFAGFNQSNVVMDYWKEPGDETRFPGLDYQFTQFDDRLLEDASFIRLKNVTLSYTLPEQLVARSGFIKTTKIFFTGRNLLTFTEFEGPDPEVDSNLTMGVYPNTRQYTLGITMSF